MTAHSLMPELMFLALTIRLSLFARFLFKDADVVKI